MVFNHLSEFMIRGEATPFELLHPMTKEFGRPSLRGIGPKVVERFLQQMRFKKLAVDAQQGIESLSGIGHAHEIPETRE